MDSNHQTPTPKADALPIVLLSGPNLKLNLVKEIVSYSMLTMQIKSIWKSFPLSSFYYKLRKIKELRFCAIALIFCSSLQHLLICKTRFILIEAKLVSDNGAGLCKRRGKKEFNLTLALS